MPIAIPGFADPSPVLPVRSNWQLENRRPSPEDANKPSLKRRTQRPDVNGDDKDTKDTSSKNKKDKDGEFTDSKFVEISNKVTYKV